MNNINYLKILVIIGLFVFLMPSVSADTHNVSGIVTNSTGSPIIGANVTVNSSSNTTNATGYYTISGIINNTYSITATASGYCDYNGSVTVSGDTTRDFSMIEIGTITLDEYVIEIQTSQNTVLQLMNGTFGNIYAGSTQNLTPSFNLTNSGNMNATIDATFTSSYGGIYGMNNVSAIVGGANFSLQKVGGTYTSMDNLVTDTTMTDIVLSDDTPYNWNMQAIFPAGQDAGSYVGTIQLTFSNN